MSDELMATVLRKLRLEAEGLLKKTQDELAAEREYTAELKADVLRLSSEVARLRKNMKDSE